ncbi:MAG: nucleotidyltransferase [Candidatus Woesearchaeota archaeon]|nr:nucleotidyltransferase [Candidatus Woesearchaeota archaeon]
MINITGQNELFNLLGAKLDEKAECLAIGGSAMMFYGAKTETKDVDLVFLNKKPFELVKIALYEIGFNEKKNVKIIFPHYEIAKNKPIMMEGRDTRFNLFLNEVISLKISDSILSRVKETHEFGNLIIKIISPEDIIMLKCATEREKDRDDAASLIEKFNIDWNVIMKESVHQTEIGDYIFPVYLFDFLYELKNDFKIEIPEDVIRKTMKIGEKMMEERIKTGDIVKVEDFTKKKKIK